jgi:hypothetical protein
MKALTSGSPTVILITDDRTDLDNYQDNFNAKGFVGDD